MVIVEVVIFVLFCNFCCSFYRKAIKISIYICLNLSYKLCVVVIASGIHVKLGFSVIILIMWACNCVNDDLPNYNLSCFCRQHK